MCQNDKAYGQFYLYGISNTSLTTFKVGSMNRRDFFLATLSLGSLSLVPKWANADEKSVLDSFLEVQGMDMAPLERLGRFGGSSEIEGDTPDEAHEIFWNKDGYIQKKGGIPQASEHFDVVIVGGGIAGLSSAYLLKGKKILLIEGNPRLGGNSKSQKVGRNYVSQGAAYITIPDDGDEIDTFLRRLNLKSKFRKLAHHDEAITLGDKFVSGFWQGATDPDRADDFKRAYEKLADVYENRYPEIPVWDDSSSGRSYFNSLDRISFTAWLKRELGSVHPHIMEYITLYCWSSFGAAPDEISAAQGLNFLTCDMAGTLVLPGGNGLISEALYHELKRRREVTLLTESFVVDVTTKGNEVQVCFKDSSQKLVSVSATHCIFAGPKMVAKKIISNIPAPQLKAMEKINYRAYLVGNVFLKKKVPSKGYDIFTMSGKVPTDGYNESKNRVFADVVFADWAIKDAVNKSILTLYMPLPYDMAQQYLFVPTLYEKYVGRIQAKLAPFLEANGLTVNDIEGIRLVRYGHALPVAEVGGVSSGQFEAANASIDGRIHFANQDNWGNPCFETSFGAALRVAEKIH